MQPAAIVLLEQVSHGGATGSLIGLDPDELSALVGGTHSTLGQEAAKVMRLLVMGVLQSLPHLLLARVVRVDRECHELVEGHAVRGIDVEQLR